jgi:hypothetical protein
LQIQTLLVEVDFLLAYSSLIDTMSAFSLQPFLPGEEGSVVRQLKENSAKYLDKGSSICSQAVAMAADVFFGRDLDSYMEAIGEKRKAIEALKKVRRLTAVDNVMNYLTMYLLF